MRLGVAPHGSAANIPTRVWGTLMGVCKAEPWDGPRDLEGEDPGRVPTQESLLSPASVASAFKWGQGDSADLSQLPAGPAAL